MSGAGLEMTGNGLEKVEYLLLVDAEDLGLVDCLLCASGVGRSGDFVIGVTCTATDVTDKTPFFIRSYHVKEDKRILVREMKRLCYLGILKEGFSAYSSPVMLISRKKTQDKRVVTDFRHLNTRIAKNNLAYPLVKDTFTMLGNSKCEVLSVLDLKDAFHSFRLSKKSKKYCGILLYFGSASLFRE